MRVIGLSKEELGGHKIKKGKGCSRCHNTGFRGRLGIFEMLTLNNELRELAFNRAPTSQVRKAAIASGMRTLVEDGKLKIVKGVTTVQEVARHAQEEGVLVDE